VLHRTELMVCYCLSLIGYTSDPLLVGCLDENAHNDDSVLGCDFVGIIEEVGKDVTSVKVGDHIAGLIWGGEWRVTFHIMTDS
jgi:hypothetical protein